MYQAVRKASPGRVAKEARVAAARVRPNLEAERSLQAARRVQRAEAGRLEKAPAHLNLLKYAF